MLLHELLFQSPSAGSSRVALSFRNESKSYAAFERDVHALAYGLSSLELGVNDRIAVFLEKSFEAATTFFAASAAGLVFVPVNPALRAAQVRHILADCNARVLITSRSRYGALADDISACRDLAYVFLVDDDEILRLPNGTTVTPFDSLTSLGDGLPPPAVEETEMAAILYTSGSTGRPKGVVFSHRNLVAGAQSVARYLKYEADDRVINIPPYSFDFGLNQLFSSMVAGATAVLHNFTTVDDLMDTIVAEKVTGVSGVPTVMIQLAAQAWPEAAVRQVRYLSTTGGRMPESAVRALRRSLPHSDLYLMYGLTEAFRSTYLPPEEVDRRPASIGKAIPNAEVLVVRPDGSLCDPEEPGELVHKGVLVTLGYWNDPERTAERFRPAPGEPSDKTNPELAVWSGDTVKRDADGFLYYIGRRDEMIKTSGYRVSPTEVEEAVFASGGVAVAAAVGVDDALLGQSIVVFAVPRSGADIDTAAILDHCRRALPAYMVPRRIIARDELPLNPNGKIDRKALARDIDEPPPRESAAALDVPKPFLTRWCDEALDLIGWRRKKYASVADVFRASFPDRAISAVDSFHSLGGDSLSYVTLYVGLSEHLGRLPDDWAERSIADLETLDKQRAVSAVAPDVLLRVIAVAAVIILHLDFFKPLLPNGAASAMLLISGVSFARFSWSEDPRVTWRAGLRFMATIYPPLLVFLAVMFAAGNNVGPGHLLLLENWVAPTSEPWWGPGWYIENLFQCVMLMMVLGAIPGLGSFAARHRFRFAFVLVVAGLAAFALFSFVPWGTLSDHRYVTVGFFWTFALGWLIAQAATTTEKLGALAIVTATVLVFLSIVTLAPSDLSDNMFTNIFGMSDRHFWLWIVGGAAFLLFGRAIKVPRPVNTVIVLFARSMLFVYLFHLQISLALPFTQFSVQLFFGTLISIGLWVLWESLRRSWFVPASSSSGDARDGNQVLVEARSR